MFSETEMGFFINFLALKWRSNIIKCSVPSVYSAHVYQNQHSYFCFTLYRYSAVNCCVVFCFKIIFDITAILFSSLSDSSIFVLVWYIQISIFSLMFRFSFLLFAGKLVYCLLNIFHVLRLFFRVVSNEVCTLLITG